MIISSKIKPPFINKLIIKRGALIQRFHKGIQGKLTTVIAPAGYGKTTMLVEGLEGITSQVAWVSLDKHDNDFERFWRYVIAAIDKVDPGFGVSIQRTLASVQPEYFEPMISALLEEMAILPSRLVLILDDFHVVELPSIHASLGYLLDHLPPHIHLVIASRTHIQLPTARLQARDEMHRISLMDLCFQLDEGIRFFQQCMGLSLTYEDTSIIVNHTEGWISGLHMAGVSMRESSNPSEFILKFSGHQHDISNYLLEEVFGQQPEHIRSFLLNTSILSRLDSSLCEAVTGYNDCHNLLEMLVSKQLFINPIDEQREWYRYHLIFSDFLQQQLRQKYPNRWAESHAKAAGWLESHGFIEDAVDHYLAGNHYSEAVRIIESMLPDLMQLKRAVLYNWLTVLPEMIVSEKPLLEIFYFAVLIVFGEWHLAKARILVILDKLSEEKWKPYAGIVYLACANFAIIEKDVGQTSAYFEKMDKHMRDGSTFQMMGGNTALNTDYDHYLSFFNDLHEAEAFMKRWIEAWEHKKSYPFVGYLLASYAELLYEWNRLEEAELYAELAFERQDMQPFARILVRAAIHLSQIQQTRGRSDISFEILEQVKLKVDSPDRMIFIGKVDAHKAHLSLQQGDIEGMTAWLQSCGLKHTDPIPVYHIPEYLTLAKALEINKQVDKAEYILERLYRIVTKEDRLRDKIKVLIAHSIMLHRRGSTEVAIRKLASALYLAEPHKYIRSFVDEGEKMAELLSQYLHMRQNHFIRESKSPSLLYIKRLLLVLNITVEGEHAYSISLTDQEMNILRLIEKGFTNKQMAEQYFVSTETVKTHIKHIYAKLDVNHRLQLIQRAKELRLL